TERPPRLLLVTPVDEAAAHLVEVIREVRPQVLVTYDPDGGYGHPDHIQTHRVAMRAADLAADPAYGSGAPHTIAKIYWNRVEREVLEAAFDRLRTTAPDAFPGIAAVADVPGVTESGQITAEIDGSAYAGAKSAAMRAHATQIAVDGPFFALSNDLGQPLLTTEFYQLVRGVRGVAGPERESDLFAGVPGADATDTAGATDTGDATDAEGGAA
ncbi:N-acetyl-1-D-myo-inositol-2-amino-2-deoxy-alpha-D-glucopyranoside deacetylase, partial [Streptomyces sp. Termitarium-T10T-6]